MSPIVFHASPFWARVLIALGARRADAADAYTVAIAALREFETEPYGDLGLDAERAAAVVVTALTAAGRIRD